MSKKSPRVFSRAFKLEAVHRILAGERVRVLSQELNVLRKDLYAWRDRFRAGGAAALRPLGRPRKAAVMAMGGGDKPVQARPEMAAAELEAARKRVAELERKIGQLTMENDFLKKALSHFRDHHPPAIVNGEAACLKKS